MSYTKHIWLDEILDGTAKFRLKDSDGNIIHDNLTIEMVTEILTAGSSINAANMNNIENGIEEAELNSLYRMVI